MGRRGWFRAAGDARWHPFNDPVGAEILRKATERAQRRAAHEEAAGHLPAASGPVVAAVAAAQPDAEMPAAAGAEGPQTAQQARRPKRPPEGEEAEL